MLQVLKKSAGSNGLMKKCTSRVYVKCFSPAATTLSINNGIGLGINNNVDVNSIDINSKTNNSKTNLSLQRNTFSSQATQASGEQRGPSLDLAKSMKTKYEEMDNDHLVIMANMDSPPIKGAREEVLKRHIMSIDEVDYETACNTFKKIEARNKEYSSIVTMPYKIGIFMGVTGGFASFPLCFDLNTARWFNEHFVTTDVPEVHDLETVLEVGSWTWNWMEPPLGQISFFLLCLQFSRAQIQNLGLRPYTEMIKSKRAQRVCSEFAMYDEEIITAYSLSDGLK
mmetsp:Transcript_4166/g.6074  ORF Transcript_4166/g.6074 Transcript_4166/m.6074 type:complete len:283 (-) Transcript_4166:246-1094(-)